MKIERMRQRINDDWEDTEVFPVAMRVFKELIEDFEDLKGTPLDISSYCLSEGYDEAEVDKVVKVFNYFCHPRIAVLRPYYELYRAGIHELTADQLYHASQDGFLPDPTTGEELYDYKSFVHVSFMMNEEFFAQELEVI